MPPLSAQDLRAIRALAETRRPADAAARLNVSPSALARHIRGAESRLGVALFRRGWSGAETTGAGDAVTRQAQRILAEMARDMGGPRASRLASHAGWRHLAAVAETLRAGSVSGAAAVLGLSQPAVSLALAEAADHAGAPLFRRRADGMQPLPPAHRIAEMWRRVEAALAALPDLVRPQGEGLSGRVAVGMLPFSGQTLVIEAFAELSQAHPALQLVAVPGSYATLSQSLMHGEIDLFIGTLRQPSPQVAFAEEPLYPEAFTIIARADHPCHAGPMTREALARIKWSVAPHGTPVRRYFETWFQDVSPPPQTQSCEFLAFANAEQMILASDCVAMLCYSPEALRNLHPGLRALPVDLPDAAVTIGSTTLAGHPLSPAAAAFLEALRTRVAARGRTC